MLLSCQIWRSNQHLKIFYKVKRRREFIFNYLERGFVWLFTQFNNETNVMQSLLSKEETTWRIIPRTVIDTCGVKSSACKIVLHVHRYNSKINQKIRIISEQKKILGVYLQPFIRQDNCRRSKIQLRNNSPGKFRISRRDEKDRRTQKELVIVITKEIKVTSGHCLLFVWRTWMVHPRSCRRYSLTHIPVFR